MRKLKKDYQIILILAVAILLSFITQLLICETNYKSLIQDNNIKPASIFKSEGYNIENNIFTIINEDPQIYLKSSDTPINSIILDIELLNLSYKPVNLQVYYKVKGQNYTEENSVTTQFFTDTEYLRIGIPWRSYDELRIDIDGDHFNLKNIYLTNKINSIEMLFSKFTLFNTLIISGIFIAIIYIILKKQYYQRGYLPFIIVGFLIFIQMSMTVTSGDDSSILMDAKTQNLTPFQYILNHGIIWQYFNWGSAVIIAIGSYLSIFYKNLWLVLNTLFSILLCYSISEIVPKKSKHINWIIAGLFLIYPIHQMSSAGWRMTTAVYLWSTAIGIYALIPIKKILYNERITKLNTFLYTIALIYASNTIQMGCIIFGVHFLAVLYLYFMKKKNNFLYFHTILSTAGIIFHIICPGNMNRKIAETIAWFPEFEGISLLHKIEIGLSSTLNEFIMIPNLIFTIFCLILLLFVIKKTPNEKIRTLALIPFSSSLILGLFSPVFANIFPIINNLKNTLTKYGGGISILHPETWFYDFILIAIGIIVLLSIILSNKEKNSIFICLIILIGFASRMIMSFSPTIFASSNRTFIFMYFSLIIASIYMYSHLLDDKQSFKVLLINKVVLIAAIFSYLSSTYFILNG